MSEQVKMSDVFGEGFSLWNESGFINDGESDLGSMPCNSFTDAAVVAINSYDRHIGLIAKQEEQIKMLREAVEFAIPKIEIIDADAMGVSRIHNGQPWNVRDEVLSKLDVSLSATEQK